MFLSMALLFLQVPGWFDPASCPGLYWRVAYRGPCKTREDLDRVLALHKEWIESGGGKGEFADFHSAILSNDDLRNADLWKANLEGANLDGANLSGGVFGPARQETQKPQAPGAFVIGAPRLSAAVTTGDAPVPPVQTDIAHVSAIKADLHDADLDNSNLEFSDLTDADLSKADLADANLSHARLVGTKLDDADLSRADLLGAVLEPSSTGGLIGLASTRNLDTVTFETSPTGLIQLRKILQDQGFREQERELTYAINHRQADFNPWIERWFKAAAFELTCRYGMAPGRCLRLVTALWVIFSVFFYLAIHRRGWMILRVTRQIRYNQKTRELPMWHTFGGQSRDLKELMKFEVRVLLASAFFSLVNAFSIGYREFSIGRWLLLLPPRQFEIRPSGLARTAAGIQSLLSVYLFALWLITYFGHPFE